MNFHKSRIILSELPMRLEDAYSRSTSGLVLKIGSKSSIVIKKFRSKRNISEINGDLYYFGNTYKNVNPYKEISNVGDLKDVVVKISRIADYFSARHEFDIDYYDISKILLDDKTAEQILTVKDAVVPDYLVECDDEYIDIETSEDYSEIKTESNIRVSRLGNFDVKDLVKAEMINSLFLVKIARGRSLDIQGIFNLTKQLYVAGRCEILMTIGNKEVVTIALYIEKKLIPKIFGYKLRTRLQEVNVQELTDIFSRKII